MNPILLLITLLVSINYTGSFEEGDWVNFTNFRYVTSATMDQTIVYFGTTGGQVYASADAGDSWAAIVRDLPAVLSVEAQTLP